MKDRRVYLFIISFSFFSYSCDFKDKGKNSDSLVTEKVYQQKEQVVITNLIERYYYKEFIPPIPIGAELTQAGKFENLSMKVYVYDTLISPGYYLEPWKLRIPENINDEETKNMVKNLADSSFLRSTKLNVNQLNSEKIKIVERTASQPYLIFSRVSFNSNFKKAVVYVNYACLGCSYSILLFIEENDQGWRIKEVGDISIE